MTISLLDMQLAAACGVLSATLSAQAGGAARRGTRLEACRNRLLPAGQQHGQQAQRGGLALEGRPGVARAQESARQPAQEAGLALHACGML